MSLAAMMLGLTLVAATPTEPPLVQAPLVEALPPPAPSAVVDAPAVLEHVDGVTHYEYKGQPVPGYHLATKPRMGLFLPGVLMFGIGYLYCAYIGISTLSTGSPSMVLLAPIVGPVVFGVGAASSPSPFATLGGLLYVAIGVVQAVGLALGIAGIVNPLQWLERDLTPWLTLRMTLAPGGAGLQAVF